MGRSGLQISGQIGNSRVKLIVLGGTGRGTGPFRSWMLSNPNYDKTGHRSPMDPTAEVLEKAVKGRSRLFRFFGGPVVILLGFCILPLALDGDGFSPVQKFGLWGFTILTFVTGLGMTAPIRLRFLARGAAAMWSIGLAGIPLWSIYALSTGRGEFSLDGVWGFAGSILGVYFVARPLALFALTGLWPAGETRR